MAILSLLGDLFFPRCCLGCGFRDRYFCDGCAQNLELIIDTICPVCRRPAIAGQTHSGCRKISLNGLVSVFAYRGLVKKAIIKLKYRYVTDLAEELVGLAVTSLASPKNTLFPILDSTAFTLVPVPLHPRRERQRGFNQAELLGRLMAGKFGWQFQPDLLKRVKPTKPQVKLKGEERLANVKGVFETRLKTSDFVFSTSDFLVFDDVWTTGSTLRECGRVLKEAGAGRVWGLTLAR